MLTIVVDINPKTRAKLTTYANNKNIRSQLIFQNRIPYIEMPSFLQQFHIGWAVYKPIDLSVATAGSSSNKIYEFLANSLPIIVFDNEHHRDHLNDCKATSFTSLTKKSIIDEVTKIDNNYNDLIKIARNDFEKKYQFEMIFNNVFDEINNNINGSN